MDPLNRKQLRLYAENRSRLYLFLSDFYLKRPDTQFLDEIKVKIAAFDRNVDDNLTNSLMVLKRVLESTEIRELSQRLAIEYTRLFRGIKKGYGPPPPYESLYRGERRVVGDATLEVMNIYRKAGFRNIDLTAGPQDHIGIELKFMSYLCHRELDAWQTQKKEVIKHILELEKEFLERHLLQMLPRFSQGVLKAATTDFYIGVTKLAEGFTIKDLETVEYLLKTLLKLNLN